MPGTRWPRPRSIVALAVCCAGFHASVADAATERAAASDGIAAPLEGVSGDAVRGRVLVAARDAANCVLCHAVPRDVSPISGDVGPSLAGVANRLSVAQLRLRIVDSSRINPATVMPPYYRVSGLLRVAPQWQGKPILTAQQVEDVVAWLATLR